MRCVALILVWGSFALLAAEEVPLKSRVVSVGLFKNGLAVVKREVKLPGNGTFVLEDVPEPVHGTWWIESDALIETQVSEREITGRIRNPNNLDFQKALVGKQVTVHFREGQIPPASGKVEALDSPRGEELWNRAYQQPAYDYSFGQPRLVGSGRFLILQTEKDRLFVDTSMIAYLRAEGKEENIKQRAPVLLLTMNRPDPKEAVVTISYLSRGMAWAPSYRVDITDPKTLVIDQGAAIKNEFDDLSGTEIQLISGFPSVEFAHVTSPLSTRTNWQSFFQQISSSGVSSRGAMGNRAVMQQAMFNNDLDTTRGGGLAPLKAEAEGVDLHYQSIGVRTLKEGDALSLQVASAKAEYERIVEWIVPDTRAANGQYIQEYQRQQEPDKYQDAAWDAVRFKNPFKFPMTTAPAMVVSAGKFQGQKMSFWVNPAEETTLQITKALSIRTRSVETEDKGERQIVFVGGNDFRKTTVSGELTIVNHRKDAIKLVLRRRFSGELVKADEAPKSELREEGVYSVNPRNELTWTITLKAGDAKTLKYNYSVLVDN